MFFRNVLVDGWISRAYRSVDASYDGEETWRDITDPMDKEEKKKYHRLNFPFPDSRPALDSIDSMEPLWRQTRELPSIDVENFVTSLLRSSFYFALKAKPHFEGGLFYCHGEVRCRAPPGPVIGLLSSRNQRRIEFYANDINLGLHLTQYDVCGCCGHFRRPVRFVVRGLRETITLSLRLDDGHHPLSRFPSSMQTFIDIQGLDSGFITPNSDSSLYCSACHNKSYKMDNKSEYTSI